MTTEVATASAGGALAAANALKGNLKKVQTQLPDAGGSQFLRFLQDGSWVFGAENEEVLPEDTAAINPLSIKTGWSCWTDRPKGSKNENLGESMVPLGADPILKHDLPEKRDRDNGDEVCEWKEQISVDVRFLDGPNKGKQVTYKTTSVGGIRAMRNVIDQLILQLDEDPEKIVPVVMLDGDHYNHKSYGRTYTPVIKIKSWMALDDQPVAPVEDKTDDAPAEVEDQSGEDDKTIDVKANEAEEPDADEAPKRRRRRR